jgi:hypothetical protein
MGEGTAANCKLIYFDTHFFAKTNQFVILGLKQNLRQFVILIKANALLGINLGNNHSI